MLEGLTQQDEVDDAVLENLKRSEENYQHIRLLTDEQLSAEICAKIWATLTAGSEKEILFSELLDRFDDLVALCAGRADEEWAEIVIE